VLEEAPSSIFDPENKNSHGESAVKVLAKACGLVSAGTVEFLLDSEKQIYFLEMEYPFAGRHFRLTDLLLVLIWPRTTNKKRQKRKYLAHFRRKI